MQQSLNVNKGRDREWAKLYLEGLSTTEIGRKYRVSASTVRSHLIVNDVPRRNRVEASIRASTKYAKTPFYGDSFEREYLGGFVEDCHVRREGRQLEVNTTTTHPAFEKLFRYSFGKYGHVHRHAGFEGLHGYYNVHLSVYLDSSFENVLRKRFDVPLYVLSSSWDMNLFLGYFAGLLDAEGTIRLYNNHGHADAVLFITIKKRKLLYSLRRYLGGNVFRHRRAWRLVIYGKKVVHILERLPLRHDEKLAKSLMVKRMLGRPWREAEPMWLRIVDGIHRDVSEYKMKARSEYIRRHGKAHPEDSNQMS